MSSRRRELLDIAAELFAERGFANVTVDDIGDAAGVSGPALYHHFTGKEALLGEMLVGISEFLLEGGRRVIDEGGPDELDRLVRFHAEFAVGNRALITLHFRDLVHATDSDRSKVRNLQARYVGLWADALCRSAPGVDRRPAQAIVHAVFGLLNSTPFSTRLPRDQMLDLLTSMATAAITTQIDGLRIGAATPDDAGEILTLQRAAFLTDAQIYGDPFMSSLTQTVAEIGEQITDPGIVMLTARIGTRLVGSVRAHIDGSDAHIARLMTAPDLTGRGIGTRLMDEIETRLAGQRIGIETGSDSASNIAFYERRGYRLVERVRHEGGFDVVRMELAR